MEHGVSEVGGIGEMQYAREYDYRGEDAHGDMPGDDLADQHVGEPDQQTDGGYFSQATSHVTYLSLIHI